MVEYGRKSNGRHIHVVFRNFLTNLTRTLRWWQLATTGKIRQNINKSSAEATTPFIRLNFDRILQNSQINNLDQNLTILEKWILENLVWKQASGRSTVHVLYSLYLLRGPPVIFCHFFSQNFYIIRLLKTTHPIKFLGSSNWAQMLSE